MNPYEELLEEAREEGLVVKEKDLGTDRKLSAV